MKVRAFLSFVFLAFAASVSFDAAAHSGSSVDGTLTHLVGDMAPSEGSARFVHYSVQADDGHSVPVDLRGASLPPGGIAAALNKRVRVITAPDSLPVERVPFGEKVSVQSLHILGPDLNSIGTNDVFPMAGNRKYKTVLCKWSDVGTTPSLPAGYFTNQLSNTYPGFDHFFREVSYGTADIAGSTATPGWITTIKPRSSYAIPAVGGNSSYLTGMANDCVKAAENSGIDFTGYDGVNLMYNFKVDNCCAWGGNAFLTFATGVRLVSATWMPYNPSMWGNFGWHDHGVLAHELSHSFNSPHSDDPSGYQYGNWWDSVSLPGINSGICSQAGTAKSADYGCFGQHQVANNKIAMGFIPAARLATHGAGASPQTYMIERMAQPAMAGGTHQVLKILTASSHKYYTVESRQRISYDLNLPGDGVIIHDVIDNRVATDTEAGDPAHLIRPDGRTTPTLGEDPNLGGAAAAFTAGMIYENIADNIRITIDSIAPDGTATISVTPSFDPATFNLIATSFTVVEGGAQISVPVLRMAPFGSAGSVQWTTTNGSGTAGTDFGPPGAFVPVTGVLTWAAGTGDVKNITIGLPASMIPVTNDANYQAPRTFGIVLSNPVGATVGAGSSTVTITDPDSRIGLSVGTVTVNEAGSNVTVNVTRAGPGTTAQAVSWSTADGTAVAGTDYGTAGSPAPSGTISFAAGEFTKTISIGKTAAAAPYVRIIDDTLVEASKTFTLTLASPTNGATLGTITNLTVTVESNDNTVVMASGTRTFTESDGAQSIVLTRAGTVGPVSVNYTFANGTATNGTHFTGSNGTISWANGESGDKSIPVTILDNSAVNATRAFTVTLSGASGATLSAPLTTVSITDNDNTVQFSAPTATVAEGAGSTTLTVTRSGFATGQAAQVRWTITPLNATGGGTDFGGPITGLLNWGEGITGAQTFVIPIVQDILVEGNETFRVDLSEATGPNLTLGTNASITVTITDDDKGFAIAPPPVVPGFYEVTEGTASITLSVQRLGVATAAASATWTTGNGTAIAGQDFGTLNSAVQKTGTLSWAANDTANKNIVIPIINDVIGGEGDKTFTVTVTPVTAGYVVAAPGTVTVTIHDNDLAPQSNVQFTQAKNPVMESAGSLVLNVERVNIGGGCAAAASVKYATVAGTAAATTDFTTKTGTLTWLPGEGCISKPITIAIVNNAVAEATEAFTVVLSAPSSGTGLGLAEATVVILDDDEVFPNDGAMPAGFSQAPGTNKGWHVSSDAGAYEGIYSLKSDQVEDNQSAGLQMEGVFAAGNVSFRVKVSSEAGFDQLKFFIDGALQAPQWSGTTVAGWTISPTYAITAGAHALKWVYTKDPTASIGMDAVYIDALVTPAYTPAP